MTMRDVTALSRLGLGTLIVALVGGGALGCGSSTDTGDLGLDDAAGGGADGPGGLTLDGDPSGGLHPDGDPGTGESTPPCTGLACQRHSCPGTGTTSISGVVYDPAGKNPLYDVVVYIPNAPVKDLALGASCDGCDSLYSGSPIVSTLTDAAGKFTLTKAPDGANIPLVVQIGKWRKLFTIPSVAQCADTPLPDRSITLPKNHSEGSIPSIAISTGGADTLECLLRRIGLDAAEYGPGASGAGHIHIFAGTGKGGGGGGVPNTSPPAPKGADALWNTTADLMPYDIVLLSCEGQETRRMNQPALFDYAAAGGRVFASHFHYSWFNTGPFGAANLATWSTGSNDIGDIDADVVTTLSSGGPFPKGVALEQWLGNVGALTGGKLPITQARHNADVSAANTASQAWITADGASPAPGATEYFTFNTPIGAAADKQCGRVVFSDLHVGAASGDYGGGPPVVPDGCAAADLSPQEKALEFMLFDLSSCVVPDDTPPAPPSGVK